MRYMGGKCLISNEIASIINPFTWGVDEEHRPFVSLFCGGCAIEAKVKADIKICNDVHPYLRQMTKPTMSVDNSILAMLRGLMLAVKDLLNMLMGGIRYEQ